MGNKGCKSKVQRIEDEPKTPTTFRRIFRRLHLKPKSWKSDSHLNSSATTRQDCKKDQISKAKSTDWTNSDLEVPDKASSNNFQDIKLTLASSNDLEPVAPPRKHKKSLKEEATIMSGNEIAVVKVENVCNTPKQPVCEEPCVRKTINYQCPLCDKHEIGHNHDHKLDNVRKRPKKESIIRKQLSVVSLPNYSDLKFTFNRGDESSEVSVDSLPNELKTMGKLETYMRRAKSFGSILPQQFKKRQNKKQTANNGSDDSFRGLEEWDLRILEYYKPKDSSLEKAKMISNIESLIEPHADEPPKRPFRRTESLVKHKNQEVSECSLKNTENQITETPKEKLIHNNVGTSASNLQPEIPVPVFNSINFPTRNEEGTVEHSTLMKILEEFSIKDAEKRNSSDNDSNNMHFIDQDEQFTRIEHKEPATDEPQLRDFTGPPA